MPESSHDRLWFLKPDSASPDPTTRMEQAVAALGLQDLTLLSRIASIPLPIHFARPVGGYDTAFDFDPATATSPDILANGWNITRTHAPYTPLTRAGDVRWMDHLWAVPAGPSPGNTPNYPPAADTYYSTLFAGRLLLQLPGETDVAIWKTITNTAHVYSAGIGGGSTGYNMRNMFMSNGAPGSAGVTCAWLQNNGDAVNVTGSGGSMGVTDTTYGARATHFAFEVYASTVGHANGRYMRVNARALFDSGNGAYVAASSIVDTGHGNGILANTSRVGVRLRSGPMTFRSEPSTPIELFYIRRQPHRANAFF